MSHLVPPFPLTTHMYLYFISHHQPQNNNPPGHHTRSKTSIYTPPVCVFICDPKVLSCSCNINKILILLVRLHYDCYYRYYLYVLLSSYTLAHISVWGRVYFLPFLLFIFGKHSICGNSFFFRFRDNGRSLPGTKFY